MQEIEAALSDISPFNAAKKRDQDLEKLSAWIPKAQQFTALANSTEEHIRALEKQSKTLWGRMDDKDTLLEKKEAQLDESMARIYALESTLRQQKWLIDRIPPEVIEQLRTPKTRERER